MPNNDTGTSCSEQRAVCIGSHNLLVGEHGVENGLVTGVCVCGNSADEIYIIVPDCERSVGGKSSSVFVSKSILTGKEH